MQLKGGFSLRNSGSKDLRTVRMYSAVAVCLPRPPSLTQVQLRRGALLHMLMDDGPLLSSPKQENKLGIPSRVQNTGPTRDELPA